MEGARRGAKGRQAAKGGTRFAGYAEQPHHWSSRPLVCVPRVPTDRPTPHPTPPHSRPNLPCPCSVGRHKRQLAEMCVKAVLAVADLERRDVNLDLIKVLTALWLACADVSL